MWNEFKIFITRGNVLDMAVGIIIGTAFGKIVSSFVADLLSPLLSLGLGKVNFADLFIALNGETYPSLEAAKAAGAATLNFGLFLNAVIDFLIVGFAIFLIVKAANKLKRADKPGPIKTKECPECLSTIPLKAKKCAHCGSALST